LGEGGLNPGEKKKTSNWGGLHCKEPVADRGKTGGKQGALNYPDTYLKKKKRNGGRRS